MTLDHLDEDDREIVHECLDAVVNGPFIPEEEFGTLFGRGAMRSSVGWRRSRTRRRG